MAIMKRGPILPGVLILAFILYVTIGFGWAVLNPDPDTYLVPIDYNPFLPFWDI